MSVADARQKRLDTATAAATIFKMFDFRDTISRDEIIKSTGIDIDRVNLALSNLMLEGYIRCIDNTGKVYEKVEPKESGGSTVSTAAMDARRD